MNCSGDSFTMVLKWSVASSLLTVSLESSEAAIANPVRYSEGGFDTSKIYDPPNRDGHIYLQSHWGSGIVFTEANFSPNTN